MRIRIIVSSLLAAALAVALAGTEGAKANQSRGRILAQQRCSQCHAVGADDISPEPAAPTFAEVAAEPSATAYSLSVFLKTPHPTMPNLILKPDDIDDIVSYVISLKPRR